jgi:hypothetical protein
MFKRVKNVGSKVSAYLAKKARQGKALLLAVVGGGLMVAGSQSHAALGDFVATDATTGDPTFTPSAITDFIKELVVLAYANWITVALIFVGVSIICWILFKKK